MTPASEPPSQPPESIAGIRIGERVRAAGPVGIHEGEDALGLAVRVYIATEEGLGGSDGAEAFLRAVGAAARAQHPSLVAFTTGGRKGPFVYAVTKDAGGRTVDELLGRGGALAPERALTIATEVAAALTALERAGARHGDLTPRRIHLPGRGQVAVRPPRVLPVSLQPRKSRYQAPEEARYEDGDMRSDLFVLGLILVEMLSGSSPLPSGSSAIVALAQWEHPAILKLAPATPPPLVPVLERLLAPDPAHRFTSATEAHQALEAAARGEMLAARAPVVVAPTQVPVDPSLLEEEPEEPSGPGGPVRAETAPISIADVAAATAPRRDLGSAPTAVPTRPRDPGRLYVRARLGEALLGIAEPTWVGWPDGALDVQARPEAFEGAVLRIEPTEDGDVLEALDAGVTVDGATVDRHVLTHGESVTATRIEARYERSERAALRAARSDEPPPSAGPARAVLAVSVLATVIVISLALVRAQGIGALENQASEALIGAQQALRESRQAHAQSIGGPAPVQAPERAAQLAYDEARALARSRPDEPDVGRHALAEVARRHPGTAHGRLAEIEARALEAPEAKRGSDAVLEALLQSAEAEAITGGLDDALVRLRNYAEANADTIGAAVARRAGVRLEAEMDARVAADMEKVDAAMTSGDLRSVMQITRRMLEYVPWSRREPVVTALNEAKRRMDAVLGGGGTTTGDAPPPRDPTAEGPDGPPDRPTPPETTEPPDTTEPGAGDDEAALTLFQDARRAMSAGEDSEALELFVELLREHKDTPTAEKYANEVRDRIRSLAAGPAGIELAFRGEVEKRDRGRWRITYDFSDVDQLDDFRDVNAFEAPPRADWSLRSGRIHAQGSGAYVMNAAFESEFLSVQVEVVPDRAHDLGVIYFEAGNQQRYYLYTIQNSFFRLGAGDGREEFREHAIALFGPDMWADTPEGEIGFVRKCGSREPKISPGSPSTIKCGKADDQVWMRFAGGRTIRGSAYGDTKYEFKGLSPGVFLVNSAGAFGKIVVEGVPDPAWVVNHWEDVLEEL